MYPLSIHVCTCKLVAGRVISLLIRAHITSRNIVPTIECLWTCDCIVCKNTTIVEKKTNVLVYTYTYMNRLHIINPTLQHDLQHD